MILEVHGHGGDARQHLAPVLSVPKDLRGARAQSGQQGRSRGITDRHHGIRLLKENALCGQPIDVRGTDRPPVTAQTLWAEILDGDEDHVIRRR